MTTKAQRPRRVVKTYAPRNGGTTLHLWMDAIDRERLRHLQANAVALGIMSPSIPVVIRAALKMAYDAVAVAA